jgi:hypothetical protein
VLNEKTIGEVKVEWSVEWLGGRERRWCGV